MSLRASSPWRKVWVWSGLGLFFITLAVVLGLLVGRRQRGEPVAPMATVSPTPTPVNTSTNSMVQRVELQDGSGGCYRLKQFDLHLEGPLPCANVSGAWYSVTSHDDTVQLSFTEADVFSACIARPTEPQQAVSGANTKRSCQGVSLTTSGLVEATTLDGTTVCIQPGLFWDACGATALVLSG